MYMKLYLIYTVVTFITFFAISFRLTTPHIQYDSQIFNETIKQEIIYETDHTNDLQLLYQG